MSRREALWIVFALPGLVTSCNAIWGIDELTYGQLGEGGASGSGGTETTSSETTSSETASTGTAGTGSGGGGGAQPDCSPGTQQEVGDCEKCGKLIEHCSGSGVWEAAVCEGMGECESGATQSSGCPNCQQYVCTSACSWGACEQIAGCCTPECGGAVCGGHDGCGGTCHGDDNDPCSAPAETWRCVWIDAWGTWGSQVCRMGDWTTFHLNPRNCDACCGSYSVNCCQASGC